MAPRAPQIRATAASGRVTRSTPAEAKSDVHAASQSQAATVSKGGLSKELAALLGNEPAVTSEPAITRPDAVPAKRYALRARDSTHTVLGPARVTKPKISGRVKAKDSYRGPGYQGKGTKRIIAKGTDCVVCAETQSSRQFPTSEEMAKCSHESNTCRTCIARHTENQLYGNGRWASVQCIECQRNLTKAQVCKLIWREDFERLTELAIRRAAETHVRYRLCLSPTCSSGQIHKNYSSPIVTCRDCGSRSCFNHRVPWHEGYSCYGYDDSHPDAESLRTSEERMKSMAKKCPGPGCGFYIEKDGGCDSMFCNQCGTPFDWASVKFEVKNATYK